MVLGKGLQSVFNSRVILSPKGLSVDKTVADTHMDLYVLQRMFHNTFIHESHDSTSDA